MTALPRQDQLFDVPHATRDDATDMTANGERQRPTRPTKARESDGVVAIFQQARGHKYKYQGAKDFDAWKRMRAVASVGEIEERWRVGLVATGWHHVDTLAQLDTKWNELGALVAKSQPVESDGRPPCAGCGKPAFHWFCKLHLCTGCLPDALDAHVGVATLEPWPKSPADKRVREWQAHADAVVWEFFEKRKKA